MLKSSFGMHFGLRRNHCLGHTKKKKKKLFYGLTDMPSRVSWSSVGCFVVVFFLISAFLVAKMTLKTQQF